MSRNSNNFIPVDDRRTRWNYYTPNNSERINHPSLPVPRSGIPQAAMEGTEDAFITGPLGLIGFHMEPNPLIQFLVLNNNGLGRQSPSGPTETMNNWESFGSSTQEDPRFTPDQQIKAKKLKKEIYNPAPKSISRRLCLYYRDQATKILNEMAREKDEDGKRCAVCLEDFQPKETVMLTPCNHMFHEECIVPWVKSHRHCPVCRLSCIL